MSIVFVDIETTGLDPIMDDIFEVAIIEEDGTEHLWRIEPDPKTVEYMHPKAAEVNRYHERTSAPDWEWSDKLEAGYQIAELLEGKHICGANPKFDAEFIRRFLYLLSIDCSWHYRLIDVESMYLAWAGVREPIGLSKMREKMGLTQVEEHTALSDARAVRNAFEMMVTPTTITIQFGEDDG